MWLPVRTKDSISQSNRSVTTLVTVRPLETQAGLSFDGAPVVTGRMRIPVCEGPLEISFVCSACVSLAKVGELLGSASSGVAVSGLGHV